MMRKLLIAACVMLAACSQGSTSHSRGVYMLLDTSGTYTEELS